LSAEKKILYVTPFPGLDKGGQVSLYHLIRGLDKNKFKPVLLTPKEGALSVKVHELGFEVYFRSFSPIKPKNALKILKDVRWLRSLIVKNGIDAVHSDHPRDTFQCIIATAFTTIPVIWHVRVTIPNPPLDFVNKFFVKKIIGVSNATEERFKGFFWNNRKFTKIYNGVDFELFVNSEKDVAGMRKELSGEFDENIITVVSQLVERKGVDEFVLAAARLEKVETKASYTIVGEGSRGDWSRIRSLIEMSGLKGKIKLLGYREDVPKIISASDVIVLASHDYFEGCPRVLLEAMAAGKPVVATNVRGIREVVTEDTGILVPQKAPEALAEGIKKLLTDDRLRKKMGVKARERAEEKFDIKLNVSLIQEVYEELLTE